MDEHFEVIVIGAGVVGLAVARSLSRAGRPALVLERHDMPAQETTSRNSGVVHSGIYYPAGSLKARLCVEGRRQLYEYAESRGVSYQRCGKVIVAQEGQEDALESLRRQALRNGVDDMVFLSAASVRELEPQVRCASGLWCPSTGIIDVHELVHALIADIEAEGGSIAYRSTFESAILERERVLVRCSSGGEAVQLSCGLLVNAAGLGAVGLLGQIAGFPARLLRTAWFAKGNYFSLARGRPFRHLVYPMPNNAGLGIHATLDLEGSTRFGPNVEWVDSPSYDVDPGQVAEFYDSIRLYWPGLPDGSLQPGYAGVRPKLVGPGAAAADFVIEGPESHGCAGLVNLLGIESPGLTSALAIGDLVAGLADM